MTTKKQLAALAKGREKLAKSRKLNGLKDLFKSKKDKPTEAKKTVKKTVKKSSKATATAKKAVRKQLSETKKKVRKATTKIFNDAKKKANKTTKKALDATKKTLAKKGLAGTNSTTLKKALSRLDVAKLLDILFRYFEKSVCANYLYECLHSSKKPNARIWIIETIMSEVSYDELKQDGWL
ncbi:MAG: hypothetical protein J6W37_05660 [Bacteroidales bacterium]|nr:hypothetical protein [Bacteroidales bacterium]